MDPKKRYKQLIKENNDELNQLSDSFRRIAYNYTKKARGYGVKSLDTEVRIKEVLDELTSYDEKHLDANIVIPNMTEYIEAHIKLLSKAPHFSIKIKEIIAVSILILCIIGYFVLNAYLNRKMPLGVPSDAIIEVAEPDKYFRISWSENPFAEEGYEIKIYKKDVAMEPIIKNITKSVIDGKQICEIKELSYDGTSIYIFEIKAKATDEYKESEVLTLTYPKGN